MFEIIPFANVCGRWLGWPSALAFTTPASSRVCVIREWQAERDLGWGWGQRSRRGTPAERSRWVGGSVRRSTVLSLTFKLGTNLEAPRSLDILYLNAFMHLVYLINTYTIFLGFIARITQSTENENPDCCAYMCTFRLR